MYGSVPCGCFPGWCRYLTEYEHKRSAGKYRPGTDGPQKGEYEFLNPNDHLNKAQSTNDAYPTGFRIAVYNSITQLIKSVEYLKGVFDTKANELKTS